jgi:hypothetical protein
MVRPSICNDIWHRPYLSRTLLRNRRRQDQERISSHHSLSRPRFDWHRHTGIAPNFDLLHIRDACQTCQCQRQWKPKRLDTNYRRDSFQRRMGDLRCSLFPLQIVRLQRWIISSWHDLTVPKNTVPGHLLIPPWSRYMHGLSSAITQLGFRVSICTRSM